MHETKRAERYRKQAAAIRHLGDIEPDPDIKWQYIEIAESYLRLADNEEIGSPLISRVARGGSELH
jgi:hypothetical protein